RDVAVTVVAPDPLPMARILGDELGCAIRDLHQRHGVSFRLGRKPAGFSSGAVKLDDGAELPADFVVVGIGLLPRLSIVEQAGLAVDRGVKVNEYLATSAPGVFAAGDIVRWPDRLTGTPIRVEHWVVAQRQGQTAARNMMGKRERFVDVPFFWTRQYDFVSQGRMRPLPTTAPVGPSPSLRSDVIGRVLRRRRSWSAWWVRASAATAAAPLSQGAQPLRPPNAAWPRSPQACVASSPSRSSSGSKPYFRGTISKREDQGDTHVPS